jgi:hypothetical protein
MTLTASLPAGGSDATGAHHGSKAHLSRAVIVGRASVRLPAGTTRTVHVSLDKTGVSALSSLHRLRAVLTIAAGGTDVRTTTVSFTVAKAAHGHHATHSAHHHAKASTHHHHHGASHRPGGSGTRHGGG